MTLEESEDVAIAYESLCERACKIWDFQNPEYVRVWFQDGKAYARSVITELGYYGDSYLESQTFSGPPEPLLWPEAYFEAWLKQRADEQERERKRNETKYKAEQERRERAMLQALQQKYGKRGLFG